MPEIRALWTTRYTLVDAPGPGRHILPGVTIIHGKGGNNYQGTPGPNTWLVGGWRNPAGGVEIANANNRVMLWNRNMTRASTAFGPPFGQLQFQMPGVAAGFSQMLPENRPLVLLLWSVPTDNLTEEQWNAAVDTLITTGVDVIFRATGGRFVTADGARIGTAMFDSQGRIISAQRNGTNPFDWDDAHYSYEIDPESPGTGAIVTPVLDAQNRATQGINIISPGNGYAEVPAELTIETHYRIWEPA